MFILLDKHPGIAVHFQSNFKGLMCPVESVWSISLTVDKEMVLWKTNIPVLICLTPAGEAPSVWEHLVHIECVWDNVLLKSRKSGYKVCALFIWLIDDNRILPVTGLCSWPSLHKSSYCIPCWKSELQCASANLLWHSLLATAQSQPSGIPAACSPP